MLLCKWFINLPSMKYTIVILYRATHLWLTLSRQERGEFFASKIAPLIRQFDGKLSIKLCDSEAFHAKTSDFMLVDCNTLKDYYYFSEYLRDTELFGKPYIEINDIVIGINNGFKDFEESEYKKNSN